MKLTVKFLLFTLIVQVLNENQNQLETKIKIACVIGKNISIKVKHVVESEVEHTWSYEEITGAEQRRHHIASIYDANRTYELTNDTNVANKYKLSLNMVNRTLSSRINVKPFEVDDGARRFIYSSVRHGGTRTIGTIVYETSALDKRPECSRLKPNGHLTSPNLVNVISVDKNQKITLYCSFLVRSSNEDDESRDIMLNWFIEKPSRLNNQHFDFANTTVRFVKLNRTNGFNIKYWTELTYESPVDNLEAWRHHNEPIFCRIGHSNYFDGSSSSEDSTSYHSMPKNTSRIPNLSCRFQLNVQFEPFIHPDISRVQEFYENQTAQVECPIKANNHMPVRYFIIWSVYSNRTSNWVQKLQMDYVSAADFYFIDRPDYLHYHNVLVKCELFEIENHYNPKDYKQHIYNINREDRKYKFLFESIVQVKIIPQHKSEVNVECSTNALGSIVKWMVGICVIGLIVYAYLNWKKITQSLIPAKKTANRLDSQTPGKNDSNQSELVSNSMVSKMKIFKWFNNKHTKIMFR